MAGIGMAIPCPVCADIQGGFDDIKRHLQALHEIRVTHHQPGGFRCYICHLNFGTYRWWKNHFTAHHAGENNYEAGDNPPENNEGDNIGMEVDLPEPVEDNMIILNDFNEVHEMEVDVPEINVLGENDVFEAEEGFDDQLGRDLCDESDWSTDSEDGVLEKQLNELETLPNGRKNIKHATANMIVDMRSVSGMTRVGVRRAMNGADLVMRVKDLALKDDVLQYLTSVNLNNTPGAKNLLKKIESPSPFKGIYSNSGQISAIKKFYSFIQPKTIYLQPRLDQRLRENAEYVQRHVPNSMEVVSVIEILKNIATHPEIMDYMRSLQPSQNGMLSSYTDGDEYRNHPFFQEHPDAFQLVLYEDGVDPARSQGSKSGIYELANFLIRVLNVPPWVNSTLGALHPLILANANDCKGTFEAVLRPFVDELCQLEEGVRVFINGEFVTLYATLVGVKGDSKAVHELLGFLGCGARHFCRQCMISRQELHEGEIVFGEPRTPQLTEMQLALVALNEQYSTQCGLRYRPVLHDSDYFRAEDNCNFDWMHDGNEGLIPMVTRLCLKQFVVIDQFFNVDELNQRVFAFRYGKQNMRDKPNIRFTVESLREAHRTYTMKQNAVQVMVLFRALPFLLDGIGENGIPEDNDYLQMLLLLLKISGLAMAQSIPRNVIPLLRRQLEVFRRSWYILFPDVNPINRFHQMMHMPDNTIKKGPMRQYACFREEGKNCPIKRHVAVCGNFKNPQKTSMEQAQIYQAKVWGRPELRCQQDMKFVTKESVFVHQLPLARSLQAIGFSPNDTIITAKAVLHHGFEFRVGEFLLISPETITEDGFPRFGKICCIMCPQGNDILWLGVQSWKTVVFVDRLNAFEISTFENGPLHLIDFVDLPTHPPISRWRDYTTDKSYLSLKYSVF